VVFALFDGAFLPEALAATRTWLKTHSKHEVEDLRQHLVALEIEPAAMISREGDGAGHRSPQASEQSP